MKFFTMRRLAACVAALLLVSPPLLTGCDDYDDSELWQNVNDLKSRIEALETKIGQMNTEIAALQKIVDDAVTVVKVEKGADGYVIGVEGAAGADLNDVYYVTGVYCEESRYNANKFTWYAQAVSLADGSASDIELDETDADNALKSVIDGAKTDEFTVVNGLYTFDDDIATAWDGDKDYTVYGFGDNGELNTNLKDALAMDDTKFSTTIVGGGSGKTFYVDENTQYLGVDDYADDIDTVYAMGGMKGTPSTGSRVIVIADTDENRDALYVILLGSDASVGSADILYAAGSSTDKVGTDKYVREFWSMDDNTSEDITIDEKLSANGFYEVDSIDEDGVYTLKDYSKSESDNIIDEDSDGITAEDLALANTDQIYRNALSGTIDGVKFDDVSIANATIIDGRSNSDRNDSVYDREINSISRLEAALEAATDVSDDVSIDLYVKDGEITFICVTDVGGVAKDDGEQESGELDLTGVENFVCNSNIVTVDLVGTGKIPANYPVTVTLMKANSTEGDAEVGSKEHVNETAYEVNDWNNLGQIAIQESGNYYVIITIENEDGRVVDEFTSNTVRFVYTAQP